LAAVFANKLLDLFRWGFKCY